LGLRCHHSGLLLQGRLLSHQLLGMQRCGQLLLLLLLVEVLYQLLLRASLGCHRELRDRWLRGCWVYCLKLSRKEQQEVRR
jgi:hypothetical protein